MKMAPWRQNSEIHFLATKLAKNNDFTISILQLYSYPLRVSAQHGFSHFVFETQNFKGTFLKFTLLCSKCSFINFFYSLIKLILVPN